MSKEFFLIILFVVLLFILWCVYRHNFKKITIQCVNLITGAPKTGKSLLCSDLAPRIYKKIHRRWWIATHIFRKDIEEPLFYCNVIFSFKNYKNSDNFEDCKRKPHKLDKNIRFCDIDILRRSKRLAYKSVVYIQESSLTSDAQEYMDKVLNCEQSLFNKLFGHETKGGIIFYDTQSALDNHFSIKRCTSSFLWILKSRNFFFFRVLYVREMINSDSVSSSANNFNEDVDFTVRKYLVWRWCYKRYDRYYFSYLTDNYEVSNRKFDYINGKRELSSFSPLYRDAGEGLNEEELRKREYDRQNQKAIQLHKEKNKIDSRKGGFYRL